MRRLTKTILWIFLIFVLFAAWAAYYVQDKGFTHRWRNLITAEFEKRGVHATIRRLNLDPLRGLIAKDVLVFEDAEHQILLMSISRIGLDIDPVKLLSGDQSMRAFEVRNAQVSIPLDPKRKLKGEQLRLKNLSARTLMRADQIEIVRANAVLEGLNVSLTGSLLRTPQKDEEQKNEAEEDPGDKRDHLKALRDRRQSIANFLAKLNKFEYAPEANPTLEIKVDGDLAKLPDLRAAGAFQSGPFSYAGHPSEAVQAEFEWANERLLVHDINLEDKHGKLASRLEFDPSTRILGFSLKGSTDLHGQLSALFDEPKMGEVVFFRPPLVEASGSLYMDREFSWQDMPLDIIGSVRSDHLTSRGVIFDALSFDFSAKGRELYLRNGRIEHKTGILDCDVLRDSNGVRFRSTLRLDPTIFKPFVKLKGNENFLNRWTFHEESSVFVQFEGTGPTLNPTTWKSRGVVDLRNCQLNGHPISQLQGDLEFEGKIHHYRNVVISRPEGMVTGELVTLDHEAQTCYLDGVAGRVFPVHAVGWFAPKAAQRLIVYDFKEAPEVTVKGTVDVRPAIELAETPARHDYTLTFGSEADADFRLFGEVMRLKAPSGTVRIEGDSVTVSDFTTGALGGKVAATVKLTDIHKSNGYSVDLNVADVDFRQLAELYSSYKETEGQLSGTVHFEGKGEGVEHLTAVGSALIVNGNVFSIPAFGPLSKPIEEVLPKLHGDFAIAREASMSFQVADSKFSTTDFEARTNAFQLKGGGTVDLVSHELDLVAKLNLRGAPGLLLAPISKLLEFKGEGSVSQPTWRPKHIPGMRGEGLTKRALEGLGDMTEQALKKASETIPIGQGRKQRERRKKSED